MEQSLAQVTADTRTPPQAFWNYSVLVSKCFTCSLGNSPFSFYFFYTVIINISLPFFIYLLHVRNKLISTNNTYTIMISILCITFISKFIKILFTTHKHTNMISAILVCWLYKDYMYRLYFTNWLIIQGLCVQIIFHKLITLLLMWNCLQFFLFKPMPLISQIHKELFD